MLRMTCAMGLTSWQAVAGGTFSCSHRLIYKLHQSECMWTFPGGQQTPASHQ
jgi:hypothetical protein